MTRHAILCGSAPDGFTQKKIEDFHDFLISNEGGSWSETEILVFPNGVTQKMFEFVLEHLKADKVDYVLVYICTESVVLDSDKNVWLCTDKISKRVIENACADGCGQVIYDWCKNFIEDKSEDDNEKLNFGKIQIIDAVKSEKQGSF